MNAIDAFNSAAKRKVKPSNMEPHVMPHTSTKWPWHYNRKPVHGVNGITIMARFKTLEEANYFAEVVNSLYDDED